jgi:N6-adenosine-specific RNA methylase IME4
VWAAVCNVFVKIGYFMSKKYKIIYADPPWSFNNKNTGGSMNSGANAKYNTMTLDRMKNLAVNSISDEDCILFMWWVSSQPLEALQLVEAWGFTIKTMTGFTWVKITKKFKRFFGMGFWTRQGVENCLIAVKGKPKVRRKNIRNLVIAKVREHSRKPDCVRSKIVQLIGDLPKVELFARNKFDGWDVFGDEINDSIKIPSLMQKIIW